MLTGVSRTCSAFTAIASRRHLSNSPNPLSTTYRGTAFEMRSLQILQDNLSMSLQRVGGKSDGGVDLIGWWWIPDSSSGASDQRQRIRVFAQCKAEKKKLGPNYIREMEGVLLRFMRAEPGIPMVALFISESPFTKMAVIRSMSSPVPSLLLHLPSESTSETRTDLVGNAVWNQALGGTSGLLKGHLELRWERSLRSNSSLGRPGLWCQGKRVDSCTPDDIVENK